MKSISIIVLAFLLLLTSCVSSTAWTENPYDKYSEDRYLCALGYGKDMSSAELDAKKSLIELFALQAESRNEKSLLDAFRDGETSYREMFTSSLSTTSSVEELYGVQILERQEDKKSGECTALAVLDKRAAANHYRQLVDSEKNALAELKAVVEASIGTFESISNADLYLKLISPYNLHVATYNYLASENMSLISQAEGESLCRKAISAIVFAIKVNGDYSRIIESDMSKTLTSLGFRVSSLGTTTEANVNVSWNDGEMGVLKYAAYDASIFITDKDSGKTLLAFTTKEREIQKTYSAAYSRACKMIAQAFDEELRKALK